MGPGQYVPPSIPCPDGLARPSAYVYRPHAGPPTVPAPLQLDPPPDPCVPPGPRIHDYRVVMHAVDVSPCLQLRVPTNQPFCVDAPLSSDSKDLVAT